MDEELWNKSVKSTKQLNGQLCLIVLTGNKLSGSIPDELSSLEGALVHLGNWAAMPNSIDRE
jgi:hypothetical protein